MLLSAIERDGACEHWHMKFYLPMGSQVMIMYSSDARPRVTGHGKVFKPIYGRRLSKFIGGKMKRSKVCRITTVIF